jgi:hypothetical protein
MLKQFELDNYLFGMGVEVYKGHSAGNLACDWCP